MAPGKPSERSFEQLVELIDTHRNPRSSTIVQRFHFHSRAQGPTETTSEYVAVLRRFAVRAIWRIYWTICEKNLKKAFDLFQAYETTERDAHDIHFRQNGLSSDSQGKTGQF